MKSFTFSSANVRNIQELLVHFELVRAMLEDKDQQNLISFHDTYFLITKAVHENLGTGFFENDENMCVFVISFARFYFDALAQYFTGVPSSACWQYLFHQSEKNHLPRFAFLLLGVHAHINQDLSLCIKELRFTESFKHDFLAINEIIKGKLAVAVAELNEKSSIIKVLLEKGLVAYQWPMHQVIVLCRNIAWFKGQWSEALHLALA